VNSQFSSELWLRDLKTRGIQNASVRVFFLDRLTQTCPFLPTLYLCNIMHNLYIIIVRRIAAAITDVCNFINVW